MDSVFVSRISEEALTALSLAAPVQILMSAMGLGIAVGLNAVISKALGEGDQEKVKKTASAALVLAFLAWVLVSFLEVSAMRPYFSCLHYEFDFGPDSYFWVFWDSGNGNGWSRPRNGNRAVGRVFCRWNLLQPSLVLEI